MFDTSLFSWAVSFFMGLFSDVTTLVLALFLVLVVFGSVVGLLSKRS